MPTMGRPVSGEERSFGNVTIGPKNSNRKDSIADERNKERLLNKITGFQPKNDLYVDGKKHNKMGKDEFLKLLTHQLQNQDPLKPMEQHKMAGELAQFSQLEQLANLNTKMEKMQKNGSVQDKFYGASFLGKEVVTNGTSVEMDESGNADILYNLPKQASKVLVRLFDKNNAMVGEMWRENIGRGNQTITWDGTTLDGQPAGQGEYRVQVYAWDQTAEPIDVKTKVKGVVESVFFEDGEAVLLVDKKKVFLRDVDSFHVPGNGKIQKDMKGANIASALAGVEQKVAKNSVSNLPIAPSKEAQVNLKKNQQRAGLNTYGKQPSNVVTTGMTSVYDE